MAKVSEPNHISDGFWNSSVVIGSGCMIDDPNSGGRGLYQAEKFQIKVGPFGDSIIEWT